MSFFKMKRNKNLCWSNFETEGEIRVFGDNKTKSDLKVMCVVVRTQGC